MIFVRIIIITTDYLNLGHNPATDDLFEKYNSTQGVLLSADAV